VALLVLVGVAAVILLARRRRRRLKMQTAEALGAGQRPAGELEAGQSPNQLESQLADQAAQKARLEQEAIQALRQPAVKTKKSEVLAKHLAEEAKKDAAGLAQVLRTWLHEEAD
jgi:flagellar biosynthesis/type III secretory pathway M-ring protein FliF/YscJ